MTGAERLTIGDLRRWGLECWWHDGDYVAFRDPFTNELIEVCRVDLQSDDPFTDLRWMARRATQAKYRRAARPVYVAPVAADTVAVPWPSALRDRLRAQLVALRRAPGTRSARAQGLRRMAACQ